ncbi:ornithine cyclodeaminase family protein [Pandoraea terrigena]|uniref:Delta(1)-pyrroline-2-carboxylate reductase n=1 Tax=Pandoraea terrigena TaxID=2508292 RepID=A0A5E4XZG5_9BURK|nr:ornithine cyclodeaminase family protein [Pandoraea terrigena]VVE41623.1 Delta(1)-pyrroline-2-carboxylate reductase [Pandoraea terrigena]
MKTFCNAQVASVLDVPSVVDAIRTAYLDMASDAAAVQPRARIGLDNVKFSVMSAMLGTQRIAASKLYTTIEGRFRFYIALFSLDDGALMALLEGDAITGFRTSATTRLAAAHLARPESRSLGIFGSGIQARAHALAFASRPNLREVRIHSHDTSSAQALAAEIERDHGLAAEVVDARLAADSDLVVLATRASDPVICGEWLREGAFVASIGATRQDQRELDDASLRRASRIVVDWTGQTPHETGDLWGPVQTWLASSALIDLSTVIAAGERRRADATDIVIYKAVGIALQDAAVAYLAYTRLMA